MTKTNAQLSKTRRDDMDALALALGFRSKHDQSRGSHRALETAMLRAYRAGFNVAVVLRTDGAPDVLLSDAAELIKG
jgi:hypothetical protein